ncbi:MAG: hypothetical protein AAF483_11090 [Planctomycetota bacterium]
MRNPSFTCLLVVSVVAIIIADLHAQSTAPELPKRQQFNQVFVKVIFPGTSQEPKYDGLVVESWLAKKLKQKNVQEYFAVTDWVPVCDGLLADDIVDNDVWDGRLDAKNSYCPVGGDIPERENGRLWVHLNGWSPGGSCEANIKLADKPGTRALVPVQAVRILKGGKREVIKTEMRLPYVAVLIAPPPPGNFSK